MNIQNINEALAALSAVEEKDVRCAGPDQKRQPADRGEQVDRSQDRATEGEWQTVHFASPASLPSIRKAASISAQQVT